MEVDEIVAVSGGQGKGIWPSDICRSLYSKYICFVKEETPNFSSINKDHAGQHAKCEHVYVGWLHSEYVKLNLETWQDSHSNEPAISGVLVYVHRDAFMFNIHY